MQDPNVVIVTSPVGYALWQALPNLICGFGVTALAVYLMVSLSKRYKAVDRFMDSFVVLFCIIMFVLGFVAPEHIRF